MLILLTVFILRKRRVEERRICITILVFLTVFILRKRGVEERRICITILIFLTVFILRRRKEEGEGKGEEAALQYSYF